MAQTISVVDAKTIKIEDSNESLIDYEQYKSGIERDLNQAIEEKQMQEQEVSQGQTRISNLEERITELQTKLDYVNSELQPQIDALKPVVEEKIIEEGGDEEPIV